MRPDFGGQFAVSIQNLQNTSHYIYIHIKITAAMIMLTSLGTILEDDMFRPLK